MDFNQFIDYAVEEQGITKSELGRRMGKTPGDINRLLHCKNNRVGSVLEYARALGYKVVLIPEEKKIPKGGVLLEEQTEEFVGKRYRNTEEE